MLFYTYESIKYSPYTAVYMSPNSSKHKLQFWKITYTINGESEVIINGEKLILRNNTLLFVKPTDILQTANFTPKTEYKHRDIYTGSVFTSQFINKEQGANATMEENSIYDTLDLSIFDLSRYDNGKYMQYYWDNEIMYNESAMILKNADGSLDPVQLLYGIDKIVSVRSANLEKKYQEGVDYKIENGQLVILPTGNIPIMEYEQIYFSEKPQVGQIGGTDGNGYFPTTDGKYEKYVEAGMLYDYQIAVTYYHKDKGNYTVPTTQSRSFPRLIGKFENGESVNIACLGDSISNGSNASGFFSTKINPCMPTYFGLFGDYVKEKYHYKNVYLYENGSDYVADKNDEETRIKMTNFSVGGKDSYWGLTQTEAVSAVNPDLVILGFGMNDGSSYTGEQAYYNNMLTIIQEIRKSNPNCEFLLLSTMLPNEKITWSEGGKSVLGNQEKYLAKLQTLAQEEVGVALADITTLHKEYLTVKKYKDMTGNNVNHPNDFLVRLYAQTIVKTILG